MSEVFNGTVEVQNASDVTTAIIDGRDGTVTSGGNGTDGRVVVRDDAGRERMVMRPAAFEVHDAEERVAILASGLAARLEIGTAGKEGDFCIHDATGREAFHVDGRSATVHIGTVGNPGDVIVHDTMGRESVTIRGPEARLRLGAHDTAGDVVVRDADERDVIRMNGSSATVHIGAEGLAGSLDVHDASNRQVLNFTASNAVLTIGAAGNEGDIEIRDGEGRNVLAFNGENATLDIGATGNEGDIIVRDAAGTQVFHVDGGSAIVDVGGNGQDGDVRVFDENGTLRIHLDGESGDIKLFGADCAENFAVADADRVEAGTVLVIEDSGRLCESCAPYDRRVAGVVSGAGTYAPGLVLDSNGTQSGRKPIALVGKVYCKADAASGGALRDAAGRGAAHQGLDPFGQPTCHNGHPQHAMAGPSPRKPPSAMSPCPEWLASCVIGA